MEFYQGVASRPIAKKERARDMESREIWQEIASGFQDMVAECPCLEVVAIYR